MSPLIFEENNLLNKEEAQKLVTLAALKIEKQNAHINQLFEENQKLVVLNLKLSKEIFEKTISCNELEKKNSHLSSIVSKLMKQKRCNSK